MEHEARASGTLMNHVSHSWEVARRSGLLSLYLLTLSAAVLLEGLTSFLLPRRIAKSLGRRTVIIAMMLLLKIYDIFLSSEDNLPSHLALGVSSSGITKAANQTSLTTKPQPSTRQANGP